MSKIKCPMYYITEASIRAILKMARIEASVKRLNYSFGVPETNTRRFYDTNSKL